MIGEPLNNSLIGILPLAIVMIPFIGAALATPLGRLSEKYRDYLTLAVTAVTCLLSAVLFFYSWQETVVTAKYNIGFGELPLYFKVDQLGAVFTIYSHRLSGSWPRFFRFRT
jgi:NADH:ubiquinone oxidoreductase subunit 5 (subunit L)/multisubunit Na+/H+ antiporter MnhA subunit